MVPEPNIQLIQILEKTVSSGIYFLLAFSQSMAGYSRRLLMYTAITIALLD